MRSYHKGRWIYICLLRAKRYVTSSLHSCLRGFWCVGRYEKWHLLPSSYCSLFPKKMLLFYWLYVEEFGETHPSTATSSASTEAATACSAQPENKTNSIVIVWCKHNCVSTPHVPHPPITSSPRLYHALTHAACYTSTLFLLFTPFC